MVGHLISKHRCPGACKVAQWSSPSTYQVAYGMVGHLISKVLVHPKWPTAASRGTYQVAYGMVGHLMSKVGVHPKRPTGALRGTYQVAYAVVGHLISKVRVHPKCPTGAPRGTYQVAHGMVGHLMSKTAFRAHSHCRPRLIAAQDRRRFHKQFSSSATREKAAANRQLC